MLDTETENKFKPTRKKGYLSEEAIYVRLPKTLWLRLEHQVFRMSSSKTMIARMALTKYLEELEAEEGKYGKSKA